MTAEGLPGPVRKGLRGAVPERGGVPVIAFRRAAVEALAAVLHVALVCSQAALSIPCIRCPSSLLTSLLAARLLELEASQTGT